MNKFIVMALFILVGAHSQAAIFRNKYLGFWQMDYLDESGKRVSLGMPVCITKDFVKTAKPFEVDGCVEHTVTETETKSTSEFLCLKERGGPKGGRIISEWLNEDEYKMTMDLGKFKAVYFHKYLGNCKDRVSQLEAEFRKQMNR